MTKNEANNPLIDVARLTGDQRNKMISVIAFSTVAANLDKIVVNGSADCGGNLLCHFIDDLLSGDLKPQVKPLTKDHFALFNGGDKPFHDGSFSIAFGFDSIGRFTFATQDVQGDMPQEELQYHCDVRALEVLSKLLDDNSGPYAVMMH